MSNFDLADLALQAVCPGNVLLYDDVGMPSIMVKVPKLTFADLGLGSSGATFPAFIVNGQEVSEIYISKYINIVQNSRAYSLPGQNPKCDITWDTARQACEKKGAGWHMMTRIEWAAILRWCQMNGVMPKGNNNYGKFVDETVQKAIPMTYGTGADAGKIFITATGTGPLTWNHDQTPSGIADLVGDVSEWHGGIRRVGQELQILTDNDGADSNNSQGAKSACWKCINGTDGTLMTPDTDASGNYTGLTTDSVKMTWASSKLTFSTTPVTSSSTTRTITFSNIVCDASVGAAAQLVLQSLGLLLYDTDDDLYKTYEASFATNDGERLFHSGCTYGNPTRGLSSFNSNYGSTRSYTNPTIGFRSAYIELPAAV